MISGMASRQGRTAFQVLWFGVKGPPRRRGGDTSQKSERLLTYLLDGFLVDGLLG